MGLELKYPLFLLFFIPAGVFIYLFYTSTSGLKQLEKNVIVSIRSVIFALVIIALTVPQMVIPTNDLNVIFAVDTSKSMIGSQREIFTWIDQSIKEKAAEDQYAIVSVGKHSYVEQGMTNDHFLRQQSVQNMDGHETNIEQGLQMASSLFPNGSQGRIVLFSDGNETVGNLIEMSRFLKEKGIILDYIPISGRTGEDLAITDFSIPASLYEGEMAKIQLKVTSNYDTSATVRLLLNNGELLTEEVEVKEGTNQFTFSHKVEDTGLFVYKGEIIADGDTFVENNSLHAVSNVFGIPKVLIVQSENNDNHTLTHALVASGLSVDEIIPEQLPTTLSEYIRYESIIFNNIPATNIGEKKMELLESAVKDFGTGFIMTGGENSFGLGGYFKTPIEDILPVDMEIKGKQEMPSLGLVIVLDRSGSMDGQKLSLAKEAAARSVELLRDQDTLGFIAFDEKPWEIIETGPLENKEEAIEKIRSVTVGGGTEIYSALRQAFEELSSIQLQRKHIILLTDGQSVTNNDYFALIDEGKETNITLSTVALGQDADKRLLESLAEYGSGRFYDVHDDTVIPSILSRETAMITRTYIEDQPFYPVIHQTAGWSPLFDDGVPQMNAYIAVTPKSMAQLILSSEKEDPVLAEWQYGLGRTMALMTDTAGEWSGDWARWEHWPDFLNTMVNRTFPQFNSDPFNIHVDKGKGRTDTSIQIQSAIPDVHPIEATVVSQTGESIEATSKIVAPGKYQITMDPEPGLYFLQLRQIMEDGHENIYRSGFTIPYSDEFLLRGMNEEVLKEASERTGGRKLVDAQEAFDPLPNKQTKKKPITSWLLLIAFILFFFEIALRRFGMSSLFSFIKWKRLDKQPKETKQSSVEAIRKKKVRKNNKPKPQKISIKQETKLETKDDQSAPIEKESENRNDNIQRLLEAKKRRNQ